MPTQSPPTHCRINRALLAAYAQEPTGIGKLNVLTHAGLMDLVPDPTPEGKQIRELQELARHLPAYDPNDDIGEESTVILMAVGLVVVLLVLLILTITLKQSVFCLAFGFFSLTPGAYQRVKRLVSRSFRKKVPDNIPLHILDILKSLEQHHIYRLMGPVLVESLPGQSWLQERIQGLSRAFEDLQKRRQDLTATRNRIQELNEKLGRPPEDSETELLGKLLSELDATELRINQLKARLQGQLLSYHQRTETLQLHLQRQQISGYVDSLIESKTSPPSADLLTAELEAMQIELVPLQRAVEDETHRINAILEIKQSERILG